MYKKRSVEKKERERKKRNTTKKPRARGSPVASTHKMSAGSQSPASQELLQLNLMWVHLWMYPTKKPLPCITRRKSWLVKMDGLEEKEP